MSTSADKRRLVQPLPAVLGMEEVAELLGLSAATVRQLVKDGHLWAHRPPGGRKWLFRADEVLENVSSWSSGEEGGTPEPAAETIATFDPTDIWCPAPSRCSDESAWLDACAVAWCDAARRAGLDPQPIDVMRMAVQERAYDLHLGLGQQVRVIDDEGDETWQPIEVVHAVDVRGPRTPPDSAPPGIGIASDKLNNERNSISRDGSMNSRCGPGSNPLDRAM